MEFETMFDIAPFDIAPAEMLLDSPLDKPLDMESCRYVEWDCGDSSSMAPKSFSSMSSSSSL